MVSHLPLTLIVLAFITVPFCHGLVYSNEDNPTVLDKVLQVLWEPSSLIRFWVGLDQLYNVVLSWRGVAKKIVSLPFDKGRSMDYVKIQEPRSLKYGKPSVASHGDSFNEIYSSSNLSPIVADARHRLRFPGNNFQASLDYAPLGMFQKAPDSAIFGSPLPLPLLLQAQDELVNPGSMDLLKSANEIGYSLPFQSDPEVAAKLLGLRELEGQRFLPQSGGHPNQFGVVGSLIPQQQGGASNVLNAGPQQRLNSFLNLMKVLGDAHENNVRRESLESGDS